jgi:hypothetical protein
MSGERGGRGEQLVDILVRARFRAKKISKKKSIRLLHSLSVLYLCWIRSTIAKSCGGLATGWPRLEHFADK